MQPHREGRVVQHGANRYLVHEDRTDPRDDSELWSCSLRGRLRQGRRERVTHAVIGDRVRFTPSDAERRQAVIEEVLPRANQISRPQPSGGSRRLEQVVVANLDRLCVVVSLALPPLNLRFVDRIVAAATLQGVGVGVVLNKIDLPDTRDPGPIVAVYERLGYPVRLCSAVTGAGLAELAADLRGRVEAFVGLSGVGKSSLLGAIQPGLELRVQSVGERHGHGRHTTTASRLYWLPAVGGWVADTPGMREFELWGALQKDLGGGFVEIAARHGDCRFRDCLHRREPDCAVRAAVAAGEIDKGRFESYLALLEELPVDDLDRERRR
jgi:ribosome biogenesis GTPase / thiamine phosphate phosphatase